MTQTSSASLALFLVLVAPCVSQGKIYIVDQANGPGTHFRYISAAVARAVAGDRINVRKGTYSGFDVWRGGISIIGSPGVVIKRSCPNCSGNVIRIYNLPRGQTFRMTNVDCQVNFEVRFGFGPIGTVVLDSVSTPYPIGFVDCERVFLTRCTTPNVYLANSPAVISDSRGLGGLTADKASKVVLVNTPIKGSPGYWVWGKFYPAPSPIYVGARSSLTITGNTGTLIQGGATTNPVIAGSGSLVWDPRVQLKNFDTNGAATASTIKVARRTVPYLDARGAPLGGTVNVTMRAGANHPFLLAVGLPGLTSLPGLGGWAWLDLKTAILVSTGNLDGKGEYSWSTPVPMDNVLLGLTLVWQGTAGPTVGTQVLSNPSAYTHGF